MRRTLLSALLLPALGACAGGGAPLLEDEVRAPGSTQQRLAREGRAALPDRMREIRTERRRAARAAAPTAAAPSSPALPGPASPGPALPSPAPSDDGRPGGTPTIAPPADFARTAPAPSRPAPLPSEPAVEAFDPYFAAGADAPGARVGAPATVGAAPAPSPLPADDAPFALRGDGTPSAPSADVPPVPAGQPAYPLDPVPAAEPETVLADLDAAPTAIALPVAQAGQSEGLPDAYVADPEGTLAAINALRDRYGAGPLRYDPTLSAVALAHARDMAGRGEVAATGPDGEGVLARARAMGVSPTVAGSLVAGGYADVPAALATWRGDKAQRDRLLLAEADRLGLALVEDRRSPFRYYIEAIVAAE